ncbi:MAG: Holliday junction resolvase RuvX [Bacteroidaceae bacterium]|nr:Holliday junction resolvase RuvX [Bacteroidaceae bacterium]
MGRIIAIDYGVRRTGIAVTDPLQIIANGLTTVETPRLLLFLQDYVRREQVERFVVGKPMQTNGRESENLANVQRFVTKLQQALPDIPVEWWDERYTSVMAHQTMLESGIGKMARRNKALVDEISACIILQGWMERRR